MFGDVVEEFAFDMERPAGERDLDLALGTDVLDAIREKMRDMGGIGRCGDGDDGFGFRIRPAAARIAAPPRLCPIRIAGALRVLAQMIGGEHEVGDVGGEGRIGEIALAGAQAR